MKLVYTVRDHAAEFYFPIFQANTDKEAIRMFRTSIQNSPAWSDYDLVRIGEFDDDLGTLKAHDAAQTIMKGANLARPVQEEIDT